MPQRDPMRPHSFVLVALALSVPLSARAAPTKTDNAATQKPAPAESLDLPLTLPALPAEDPPLEVIDAVKPSESKKEELAAPTPPVVAEQAPARSPWRILVATGLDLGATRVRASSGSMIGARYRIAGSGEAEALVGLRASYAPRQRTESIMVPGRGFDPQARFFAHTGDVAATFATELTPFSVKQLVLELEGGIGLAWRSGSYAMLGGTSDLGGAGLSTFFAGAIQWQLTDLVRLGLRVESTHMPQPSRPDAAGAPTDLGATRLALQLALLP